MAEDWTPERIADLTRLWASGKTGAEIAAIMKLSKNAIVGKAHRLHLPARPSPIKRGTNYVGKIAQPKQPRVTARKEQSVWRRSETPKPPKERVRAALPDVGEGVTGVATRFGACQWIVGDPRGAETRYCAAATGGKATYCAAHHAVMYDGRMRGAKS